MATEQKLHILSLGPSVYEEYGQLTNMAVQEHFKDERMKHISNLDTAAAYLCIVRDRVDGVIVHRPTAARLLIAEARLKGLAGNPPLFIVDSPDLNIIARKQLVKDGVHLVKVPIGMVEVKEMRDIMFASRPKPEMGFFTKLLELGRKILAPFL